MRLCFRIFKVLCESHYFSFGRFRIFEESMGLTYQEQSVFLGLIGDTVVLDHGGRLVSY